MENRFEYSLLQDDFIELNESNDEIGNAVYVEELVNVIKSSTTNDNAETIALIGSWGSGKSSIVSGLEKKLENTKLNDMKIKFIKYNAWKYNNDNFRKTFLIDSTEDKSMKKELEDKLYAKTTRMDFEINRKYKNIIIGVSIILIVIVVVINFINSGDKTQSQFFFNLLNQLMGLALIESLGSIIIRKIIVEKEITIEKEFSPEEFSRDFVKVTKKNKYFSIYVIDDLDRCDPIQTLEILDTIQGFLKTNNMNGIFIIPVDKRRLEKILTDQREYNNKECAEYFSKIFDVMVEIKNPGTLNLFNMLKRISEEHRFNLSNFSISILSDYIIKTPRDIKKHLNNIRLKTNVLNHQKDNNYISKSVFSNDEYDSFIKIYIIESRWPDFYMWLVENSRKYNIDSIYQIKQKYKELDDEITSFLERSRSTSIKDIYAYHYMKDEGIMIDTKLVDSILNGKTFEIHNSLENDEDNNIIINFEYAYHVYIEQRNLLSQYFPYLLKVYLSILNLNSKYTIALQKSKIKLDSIIMTLDTFLMSLKKEDGISDILPIFSNELLIYASTDNLNSVFKVVFNKYIHFLNQNNIDDILFDIIKEKKILDNEVIEKKHLMNSLELVIRNDEDNVNDFFGVITVELIEYLDVNFNKVFEEALKKNNHSFIIESISNSSNIGTKYINEIVEVLDITTKLGRSYNTFSSDSSLKDIQEVEILNLLLENNPEKLYSLIENDINLSYIPQIINAIKKNDSDDSGTLLKKLVSFYYRIAETTDNWKLLYIFIGNLEIMHDIDIIKFILNLSLENIYKNEMYIILLNKKVNNEILDDFIAFLNNEKDRELFEYWTELIKNKVNVTVSNSITNTKIDMNYNNFVDNLLKYFFNLDEMYLDLIFDDIDMNLVIIDPTYHFISSLKKNSPLINKVIRRIESVGQYEKMIAIQSKKSNRISSYHKATENIVSSVKNVDELLDINHNTNLLLDKTDKNIIKNKVENSYPHEKDKFTNISWKY